MDQYGDENFEEANKRLVMLMFKPYELPEDFAPILEDPKAMDKKITDEFWICASAMKLYLEKNNHLLPICGTVTDMVSNTENFIGLQNVFQERAQKDLNCFTSIVVQICNERNASLPNKEYIEKFCKNASGISLIKYNSILKEKTKCNVESLQSVFGEQSTALYVLMRAMDAAYITQGKYPGRGFLEDLPEFKFAVKEECNSIGLNFDEIPEALIKEMLRMSDYVVHTTAAFIGGVASQECIKLITHKYRPANNTLIYNGMKSTLQIYEL
jgi:amyloid beta precursor protein binding protein 1